MKISDSPLSSINITIEDFLRKLTLPKRYFNKDFVIAEKFHDEIPLFFTNFVRCDGGEFPESEQQKAAKILFNIRPSIEQNFSFITEIFAHHENADPKAAQNEFDKLMGNMKDDLFIGTINDKMNITIDDKDLCTQIRKFHGKEFFRVRQTESFSNGINKNAYEMFHLPISKRQKASSGRFSLAGFPSLYLSTTLSLAWQETGYPQKYYYSEYQYNYDSSGNCDFANELQFIALYSPDEINSWGNSTKFNDFDLWLEVIARYLKIYPLILACSFVNLSGDTPYKQEYIIPQMLMQWIQRNSSDVQGITYFSCLETSIITDESWAYNIALPALKPYDEMMYSIRLKEKFHWSMPNYYSIPVSDTSLNVDDRKILDDFIRQITDALRIVNFPINLAECMLHMLHISSCLQSLFACAANTDMRLVLHMLDSIHSNYLNICNKSLEKYIAEAKADENTQNANNSVNSNETLRIFSIIYNRFVENGNTTGEIKKLMDKIILSTRNSIPQQSHIVIFCLPSCNINKLTDWLEKNHILYFIHLLRPENETIAELKQMANSQEMLVDDFFSMPVGDDEWVKENISLINQPIISKWNTVSVLSSKNTKKIDFVLIGFDERELSNRLETINPRVS